VTRVVHVHLPRGFTADLLYEEKWITVHPNGRREKGVPVLVAGTKGNYTIRGGMGGKFNGKKLKEVTKRGKQERAVKQAGQQKLISLIKSKPAPPTPAPAAAPRPVTEPSHVAVANFLKTAAATVHGEPKTAMQALTKNGADGLKAFWKKKIEDTGASTLKEAYEKSPGKGSIEKAIKSVLDGNAKPEDYPTNMSIMSWAEHAKDMGAADLDPANKPAPAPIPLPKPVPAPTPKPAASTPATGGLPAETQTFLKNGGYSPEDLDKAISIAPASSLVHKFLTDLKDGTVPAGPLTKGIVTDYLEEAKNGPAGVKTPPAPTAKVTASNYNDYREKLDKAYKADTGGSLGYSAYQEISKVVPSAAPANWAAAPKTSVSSIKAYTNGAFGDINKALRGKIAMTPAIKRKVNAINKLFNSDLAKAHDDFVTYRSYNMPDDMFNMIKDRLKSGSEVEFGEKGLISTTFRKAFAENWNGNTKLEIVVSKNTPAIAVKHISEYQHEDEVLLQHGQSFKVLQVEEKGGNRYVRVMTV
jgi:ADP-ribosyltransferase exoenzyme